MLRDKDWKKNWSVSVRSFFFFRGSTSLSGSHSPVNLSYVHICVCFDCLHRFLAHTEDVCVGTSTSCLSASMYASIGFSTHSEGPNVCMFNSRHRRHTTMCCGVRMCMYASYTYCVYSRTFFLNYVRHTKRNAKFYILLSYENHARCERIDWAGCLVGLDGRWYTFNQSDFFYARHSILLLLLLATISSIQRPADWMQVWKLYKHSLTLIHKSTAHTHTHSPTRLWFCFFPLFFSIFVSGF